MNKIFSNLIIKNSEPEHDIELQLTNVSEDSDAMPELDQFLYDPKEDEEILNLIGQTELENKMVWGSPSRVLKGDENLIYGTLLVYGLPYDSDIPEVASYYQEKGKVIQWTIIFESEGKDISCTMDFYFFYRDSMGDICKLHPYEHKIEIRSPKSESKDIPVIFTISQEGSEVLPCGRYYLAFRLHKADGTYIDQPVIQYINIVPSNTSSVHVDSDMVGMEAVYSQMAALGKQKMFNDSRIAMQMSPTPLNLHAAVMGGKGSGKTSFAQVLFNYYVQNGFITEGKLHIVDAVQCGKNWENSSTLEEAFSTAAKGMLYIENASAMRTADIRGNKDSTLQELVKLLKNNKHDTNVVLADTPEGITQILETADLRSHIGQIYKLPELTIEQMMEVAAKECAARGFTLTDGAIKAVRAYLSSQPDANTTDVISLIGTMITNMSVRVVNNTVRELFPTKETLSELKAEDVPMPQIGRYKLSMGKLNALVGLKKLKYNIEKHLSLVRFALLRSQNGLKAAIPPLHMIFTGNPGTGKTTVANLLGEIYASLGILKTGHVVQVDRKKLVGQYIGDTEENTKQALKQAHGNILFVDEAYNLAADPEDKKDFGPKALDCLLEELGKESTDMIIILAGYPDEMEKLLKSNKGLQSRFPYTFHFEDYSEEELLEIAVKTAQDSGYSFSTEALDRVKKLIHREVQRSSSREQKRFGNARFITRLISTQVIPNMSRRVLADEHSETSPQFLSRIEAADIPSSVSDTDYKIDETLIAGTLRQMDELIGLDDVKQTLRNLVSIARSKQQNGEDLQDSIPLQWTFTGSTGTGKSSVAKLLAKLLHAFHLISSDRMTQLRMPQTQSNTWTSYDIDQILRDTMKQFGQGLLFIDLDDVANCHIDIQWLRCKLTSLTAEMPGSYAFVIAVDDHRLPSQPIDMPLSTSVIHFVDYSADELMAILLRRLEIQGFGISSDAAQELSEHIRTLCDKRSSGLANARTIRHIYTAVTNAAELRAMQTNTSVSTLEISKEDVQSFQWKPVNSNRIGFDA